MSSESSQSLLGVWVPIIVGAVIGIGGVFLSERLPEMIRPAVRARAVREFRNDGPRPRALTEQLAVMSADYAASTLAIFALSIALLTELLKIGGEWGPILAGIVCLVGVGGVGVTVKVIEMHWVWHGEPEYHHGLGRRLKWSVRILAFAVFAGIPVIHHRDSIYQWIQKQFQNTATATDSSAASASRAKTEEMDIFAAPAPQTKIESQERSAASAPKTRTH